MNLVFNKVYLASNLPVGSDYYKKVVCPPLTEEMTKRGLLPSQGEGQAEPGFLLMALPPNPAVRQGCEEGQGEAEKAGL